MSENVVKLEELKALLANADIEEHVFHGKEVVVSYRLRDRGGFTVTGRGACVDVNNFSIVIGRTVAYEDALNQLWLLEGYLLSYILGLSNDA
jgi:hypothetical protein